MTSSDHEILIEIRNNQIQIRNDQNELRSNQELMMKQINSFEYQLLNVKDRIEILQHSIYWGFAILGIIISLITLWRPRKLQEDSQKNSVASQPSQIQPIIIYTSEEKQKKYYEHKEE